MPSGLVSEASWLSKLLRRPAWITKEEEEDGNVVWRRRLPDHRGRPHWEEDEVPIKRYDPDGTEEKL